MKHSLFYGLIIKETVSLNRNWCDYFHDWWLKFLLKLTRYICCLNIKVHYKNVSKRKEIL